MIKKNKKSNTIKIASFKKSQKIYIKKITKNYIIKKKRKIQHQKNYIIKKIKKVTS